MCTEDANEYSDTDDAINSSGPSLEVDSDDRDSALGDNQSNYTMSVTSSVYDFKYENGRRYHAYSEGNYPFPNDETEADRLDLQHLAFRLCVDGRLYIAPIQHNVQQVLDVGCGTGIWAIEFADEHPTATVIGTDVSPIQPSLVPPNCSFIIDDLHEDWIFHHPFDYIHARALVAAVKDWDRFFQQAYTNLKPGGYLECQEPALPIQSLEPNLTTEHSPLLRWSHLFVETATQTGFDLTAPHDFVAAMRRAGFVDIHAKQYKWPIGKWAKGDKMKLLGYYTQEDMKDFLSSSTLRLFTRVLKWSREEVEVFLASCRQDMKDPRRHFYATVIFWVARKPENADMPHYNTDTQFVRTEQHLEADVPTPPPEAEPRQDNATPQLPPEADNRFPTPQESRETATAEDNPSSSKVPESTPTSSKSKSNIELGDIKSGQVFSTVAGAAAAGLSAQGVAEEVGELGHGQSEEGHGGGVEGGDK